MGKYRNLENEIDRFLEKFEKLNNSIKSGSVIGKEVEEALNEYTRFIINSENNQIWNNKLEE